MGMDEMRRDGMGRVEVGKYGEGWGEWDGDGKDGEGCG